MTKGDRMREDERDDDDGQSGVRKGRQSRAVILFRIF